MSNFRSFHPPPPAVRLSFKVGRWALNVGRSSVDLSPPLFGSSILLPLRRDVICSCCPPFIQSWTLGVECSMFICSSPASDLDTRPYFGNRQYQQRPSDILGYQYNGLVHPTRQTRLMRQQKIRCGSSAQNTYAFKVHPAEESLLPMLLAELLLLDLPVKIFEFPDK